MTVVICCLQLVMAMIRRHVVQFRLVLTVGLDISLHVDDKM